MEKHAGNRVRTEALQGMACVAVILVGMFTTAFVVLVNKADHQPSSAFMSQPDCGSVVAKQVAPGGQKSSSLTYAARTPTTYSSKLGSPEDSCG